MLKRLWNWLKNLFRRLFGKPAQQSETTITPEKPARSDAEYERVFFQMLEEVAKGEGRGVLQAVLMMAKIEKPEELVPWLKGFGARLRENPENHGELAGRMVAFGRTFGGELGRVAEDVGRGLLEVEEAGEARGAGGVGEVGEEEVGVGVASGGIEDVGSEVRDREEEVLEGEEAEAERWWKRGKELREAGRLQESLEAYNRAIAIQPDDHKAWDSRGALLCDFLHQYEDALTSFEKALELKSDFENAWHNRGVALRNLGRNEEAIASFDKALEFKHDLHEAWNSRGVALKDLGRNEEAIASFDKALEFKHNDHVVWSNRGVALSALGRYEEAISSYDKALEFKHDLHEAWNNRGNALSALGRKEEAISSFDNALSLQPKLWQAWENRGSAAGKSANTFMPSILAAKNPALNKRGYEGQIASYAEGLKYVLRKEQPEGWGKLHWDMGRAHYFAGRQARSSGNLDAILYVNWQASNPQDEYNLALETLTERDFPEKRLGVLRDYVRLLFDADATLQAESLLLEGSALLARLLAEKHRSDYSKKQLALEFSQFGQFTVDLHARNGNPPPSPRNR